MGNCGPQIKKEWKWYRRIIILILNKCLDIISPHFFQASCAKHDAGYLKGGDESRRFECDNKFFFFICRDIEKIKTNKIKKLYLYTIASIFYIAVRMGGGIAFNYKK